jgi:hypothetical protein
LSREESGRKGGEGNGNGNGEGGNGPHLPPDLAPLANVTPLPNNLIRSLPDMLAEQLVAYVFILYRDWQTDQRGEAFSLDSIAVGTGLTPNQVRIALRSVPIKQLVAESPDGFRIRRARPSRRKG